MQSSIPSTALTNGLAGFPTLFRAGTQRRDTAGAGTPHHPSPPPHTPPPRRIGVVGGGERGGGRGAAPPRLLVGSRLLHRASVVRVRPRTSGSITDLLLALACAYFGSGRSTSEKLNSGEGLSGDPEHPAARGGETEACLRVTHARDPGAAGRGPYRMRARGVLGGRCLTRYRNQPDKSLHQSGAAMHHRPQNQERALNLSIQVAS